jgi:hypothetical protein
MIRSVSTGGHAYSGRVKVTLLAIGCAALVLAAAATWAPTSAGGLAPSAAVCSSSVGPGIPPPASVPSGIPGFHAAWYGQSGYQTLCPGDVSNAVVAYYNSGSLGWVAGRMGEMAFLGTSDPEPGRDRASALGGDGQLGSPNTGWPRYNRVAQQPAAYVGPGQVAWFQFRVRAPSTPGTYRLALRPVIEGATWMEDYGVFWVFTVPPSDTVPTPTLAPPPTPGLTPTPSPALTPTPTPFITPTPTPVVTPTPTAGTGFTCTQVIGYSQTGSWFLDSNGFETVVNDSLYQILWQNGGAVHYWADPNDPIWSNAFDNSNCDGGSSAPDRVIMDVTEDFFIDDPSNGGVARVSQDIRNVIATVRSKYSSSLRQIYLQPVVGGPGGQTCSVGGSRVRASVNHPYISTAIDQVIAEGSGGFDVRRGPNPQVANCGDYADDTGHLSDPGPIGRSVGSFYASR